MVSSPKKYIKTSTYPNFHPKKAQKRSKSRYLPENNVYTY